MTEQDVDEVCMLDDMCFSIPWSKQSFENEMKNTLANYYIIRNDENKVVAYCGFWNVADEGHITNIAVHPEYRRRGYGSALVRRLIDEAKRLKLVMLTLEVREGNMPAQGLYRKYGFEVLGRRVKYYADNKEDALIMTKIFE